MNHSTSNQLLRLSSDDNVCLCHKTVEAGELVTLEGESFPMKERLTLGHKIAARLIRSGEKIIKFKAPIGSATRDIQKGEWVHLHNMKSDYLPTYTREDQEKFYAGH